MTEWTLAAIKMLLHDDCPDAVKVISAAWWMVRRIDDLEQLTGQIHNGLTDSMRRRLSAVGVPIDAEKGKISFEETGTVRESRRSRRRPSDGRSGPFSPISPD